MADVSESSLRLGGVNLQTSADSFDKGRCIICQKNSKEKVCSTVTGQKRVRDAPAIRKDKVLKRLKLVTPEDEIVYHCNNQCYKQYTMKKTLKRFAERNATTDHSESEDTVSEQSGSSECGPNRRSISTPRPPPTNRETPENLKCVICGCIRTRLKCGNDRTKYRISTSDRATMFLAATSFFQDEVFDRVADLNSDTNVFAADLYAHPNCIRAYIRKYELLRTNEECVHQQSSKFELFKKANEILEPLLNAGNGFTLTEIKELMLNIDETAVIFNNEIKIFLVRMYSERIRFCPSERKNEPLLVFSSHLSPEVLAATIRSQEAIKTAGSILRKALQEVDFGLQDKFCDASELQKSWESTRMPDVLLTFFSSLFNIGKSKLLPSKCMSKDIESDSDITDDMSQQNEETVSTDEKSVQIFCLFQIMFYELHHGQKKTPLHLMTGHTIYDKCKSRELITSMNRIGVSASYNDVMRRRNLLSAYAVESCEMNNTPLPSHFSRTAFTTAAFDNFDFEDNSSLSGQFSTHDTAMVLFQDRSGVKSPGKPSISSTNINIRSCKLVYELPCQKVHNHYKPVNRPSLPQNFAVAEAMDIHLSSVVVSKTSDIEFLITLLRCGLPHEERTKVPTWSGIHALISSNTVPLHQIGFLPVIPSPVTDYATVFTALKNFQNVRSQLQDQPILPVFCDEGVFQIVADIFLCNSEEFADLYPMMGMFHMAKVALRCAGSYISGSGMDDALIEAEIFGAKTIKSVLSGSHYIRSFQGMLIISEAIQTLQWSAFWNTKDKSLFEDHKGRIKMVQDVLDSKDEKNSQSMFHALRTNIDNLKTKFETFLKECGEKSELCKYWEIFLAIVSLVKHLIIADREGNWELHVQTVESLIPVFREFDCINYLRYASWYVERIKTLEIENPYLYQKFIQGNFVVKDKDGKFNAVAPDMKLEQTIQRSQKSAKGIVGQTRKSSYVTEWQLVYHEVLMICNVFRELTNSHLMDHRETVPHHDLMGNRSHRFDENVERLVDFMHQHINPYEITTEPVRLHNFVTKQYVDDIVKTRLLDAMNHGSNMYRHLKQERFVLKTKKLSELISKVNLPCFDAHSNSQPVTPKIISKKQLSQGHRDLEIAKERGECIEKILAHDLFPTNTLFDGDAPNKPAKHIIVAQLEKYLSLEHFQFSKSSPLKTALVVDFMSQVRMVKITKMKTFGEVLSNVLQGSISACSLQELHVVFDSYLQHSVKECERIRRQSTSGTIDLALIDKKTPVPVQVEKFWSSASNKEKLQLLVRKEMEEVSQNATFSLIASSSIVNDELQPALMLSTDGIQVIEELNNTLEEADLRIVPHIHWAVQHGTRRVVVLSNDTDVVVLLIRFAPTWMCQGMSELWIRFGTGANRRFIPIHILLGKLNPMLPKVLIKAHILTGNDEISKIGTKVSALNSDPITYLADFGETKVNCDYEKVENYLVRAWKPHSKCKTFDTLRFSEYKRSIPLSELPPTSHSIKGHILRAFYLIRRCVCLLDNVQSTSKPCDFGWENVNGVLQPQKFLNFLPTELLSMCKCKVCVSKRCSCRTAVVKCTTFCKCNNKECKNK